jgi:ribosomal protein S18 acetylase RimI-like enzyme
MEYNLVEFSQLTKEQLRSLAQLHYSVMRTLLSDLGLPFVWRYYQIAQADSTVIGVCAVSPSGELLGWAIGSPHPDRITSELRSPPSWFFLQMLRITLNQPVVLWQLISSVFSTVGHSDLKDDGIELTYIGVAADQRDRGVGETLLHAFLKESKSRGYRSVILSVEEENLAAISLYSKVGFKIINTFSEGRFQRHRMEILFA